MKQWTLPDAMKTNDRNLVTYFNAILFYVEVSIIKKDSILTKFDPFLKNRKPNEYQLEHKRTEIQSTY